MVVIAGGGGGVGGGKHAYLLEKHLTFTVYYRYSRLKNLPTLASDFSTPLFPGSLARQCKNATAASVFLLRPTKAQPFL